MVVLLNEKINEDSISFLEAVMAKNRVISENERLFIQFLITNKQVLNKLHFVPQDSLMDYDNLIVLHLDKTHGAFEYHEGDVTYYNAQVAIDRLKEDDQYAFIVKVIVQDEELSEAYCTIHSQMALYFENKMDLSLEDMLNLQNLDHELSKNYALFKIDESLDRQDKNGFMFWTDNLRSLEESQ